MTSIKDQMDAVKIETYKDCAWYLVDIDKCKLSTKRDNYCECTCKEQLNDLCVWVTKFLKSSAPDIKSRDIFDDSLLVEYGFLLGNYDPAKSKHIMATLLNEEGADINPFDE